MFDIGWGELVLIGIVALIAIGPKELPTVLRTLGQYMGKMRRMASEFQGQFQEALREAEMSDLKKQAEDIKSSFTDFASHDPMATEYKPAEPTSTPPELPPATEVAPAPVAEGASPAEQPTPVPEIDLPTPDLPAPVTEKDFAPVEPPPKKAGGGA
jgi:sec-independent protein translocase protein TatB